MTTKKPPDLTVVGAGNRKVPARDRKRADTALMKRVADEARDAQAYGMKMSGKTLRQIADHFGWSSTSSAGDAVQRYVQRTPIPEVEEAKLMSLQCLYAARDRVMAQIEARDLEGNYVIWDPDDLSKLVMALVRIEMKIADLLGTNAPKRQELTGAEGGPIRITSEEEAVEVMLAARDELDRRLKVVQ